MPLPRPPNSAGLPQHKVPALGGRPDPHRDIEEMGKGGGKEPASCLGTETASSPARSTPLPPPPYPHPQVSAQRPPVPRRTSKAQASKFVSRWQSPTPDTAGQSSRPSPARPSSLDSADVSVTAEQQPSEQPAVLRAVALRVGSGGCVRRGGLCQAATVAPPHPGMNSQGEP